MNKNKIWMGGLQRDSGHFFANEDFDKMDKVTHDLTVKTHGIKISDLWEYGYYDENGSIFYYIHFVHNDEYITFYHIFYVREDGRHPTEVFEFKTNIELDEDEEFTHYKDYRSEFNLCLCIYGDSIEYFNQLIASFLNKEFYMGFEDDTI